MEGFEGMGMPRVMVTLMAGWGIEAWILGGLVGVWRWARRGARGDVWGYETWGFGSVVWPVSIPGNGAWLSGGTALGCVLGVAGGWGTWTALPYGVLGGLVLGDLMAVGRATSYWLATKDAATYSALAQQRRDHYDWDMTVCLLTQAIRRAPDDPDLYRERGSFYRESPGRNWLSYIKHLDGRALIERALADCDQCVRLAPDDPSMRAERGRCHQAAGDLDKALADYEAALRLDPTDPQKYRDLSDGVLAVKSGGSEVPS